MEWGVILSNPEVLQLICTALTAILSIIFTKLKMNIDPETLQGVAQEVVNVLMPDAERQRDPETGKIPVVHIGTLRDRAVMKVREVLQDRKPRWLPRFLWNYAIDKIATQILNANIEGALKEVKLRNKTAE